jgi:hypothetical protein
MDVQPPNRLKDLINKTIKDLKSEEIWGLLDCLYFFNLHDQQASTLNWIKNSHNVTAVNSPTWTQYTGFTGGGSSRYLNGNFTPSQGVNFKMEDACFGVYQPFVEMVGSQYEFHGCWSNGTANRLQLQYYNAYLAQSVSGVLNGGTGGATGWLNSIGLVTADRYNGTQLNVYMNGNEDSWNVSNNVYGSLGTYDVYFLSLNNNGTAAYFSKDTISSAYLGGSMSESKHKILYDISYINYKSHLKYTPPTICIHESSLVKNLVYTFPLFLSHLYNLIYTG